jgi:hypothetical protein
MCLNSRHLNQYKVTNMKLDCHNTSSISKPGKQIQDTLSITRELFYLVFNPAQSEKNQRKIYIKTSEDHLDEKQ